MYTYVYFYKVYYLYLFKTDFCKKATYPINFSHEFDDRNLKWPPTHCIFETIEKNRWLIDTIDSGSIVSVADT